MRGRPGWEKELAMKEIWKLSVSTLKKALSCMDEKKVPFLKKVEIAQFCFGKMVPKDANLNVNQAQPIEISVKLFDDNKEEPIDTRALDQKAGLPFIAQAINRLQNS